MRPLLSATRLFALTVLVAAGAAAVAPTRARAAEPASIDTLPAERARLRVQLDEVNAEIDRLKRAGGGVRDDYRLRARLADAESLARRLMEIEARLGIRVDSPPKLHAPPIAEPTDSPADLDAKADILSDQSRRVRVQADLLARRASDAKGRQELRRRAADLDRDPFAPMEGSKRRLPSGSGSGPLTASSSTGSGPRIGDAGPVAQPTSVTGSGFSGAGASGPPSVQLRDLLDTATLIDVRRVETSGAAVGSPQALERAAAALRARADWLDGRSRDMRAKAHAKAAPDTHAK